MSCDKSHLYPVAHDNDKESQEQCRVNPAFRYYGKRLFSDQTLPEFLNELLLVLFSQKYTLERNKCTIDTIFPSREQLKTPGGIKLGYKLHPHLNLKLFSFFSASRLDNRNKAHLNHFEELLNMLQQKMDVKPKEATISALRDLENLFLGLRLSLGEDRTWCVQQFLPIGKNFLTSETTWPKGKGRTISTWNEALKHFATSDHIFMARGGEVLYSQICLALSRPASDIKSWNEEDALGLSEEERDPASLQDALEKALPNLMHTSPGLEALAEFICGLEQQTEETVGNRQPQAMGWCSADSWKEGYLFAVELLRILRVDADIIERLSLLETACGLQLIRTLCARTAAHASDALSSWPGYLLPVTAPEEKNITLRSVSQHACKRLHSMMERIILEEPIPDNVSEEELKKRKTMLEDMHKKYTAGLFFRLTKTDLGLVVPPKGTGERFVMSERVLRFLVLTQVLPQTNLSLDTFKQRVRTWHGFVFDASGFEDAQNWLSGTSALFPSRCDIWLRSMLEDCNFLIQLSDACSLVHNPISANMEV